MKLRKKLSPAVVDGAKPESAPYRIWDSAVAELFLRVQPSGVKSWNVRWSRSTSRSLGKWPAVTVTAARDRARKALVETAELGAPTAVIEARKSPSDRPITLGAFIAEHFAPWALVNQKAGRETVDLLKSSFGDLYERDLGSIVAFDLERFKTQRRKAGIAPATVNRDLDRIRRVYSCAVEWGFLAEHPLRRVKRIKTDNARVRYLTPAEEKRLRKALSTREAIRRKQRMAGNAWCAARHHEPRPVWPGQAFTDYVMPMVLLALNTGMRRGELFGLDWRSVNVEKKLLTIEAGNAKSGKARHIPLNAEALDVLKRWRRRGGGEGLVFPSSAGARLDNINKAWAAIATTAKLQDFHFHDLRHSFASKLVMAGVDLNTVRELLGHADIKMTLRYAHLAPSHLADAVAKLGGAS